METDRVGGTAFTGLGRVKSIRPTLIASMSCSSFVFLIRTLRIIITQRKPGKLRKRNFPHSGFQALMKRNYFFIYSNLLLKHTLRAHGLLDFVKMFAFFAIFRRTFSTHFFDRFSRVRTVLGRLDRVRRRLSHLDRHGISQTVKKNQVPDKCTHITVYRVLFLNSKKCFRFFYVFRFLNQIRFFAFYSILILRHCIE